MNNKGFAITTVLYGTFLLFLMLIITMLAIISNYRDKMELLIESNNGARDIVDRYNAGSEIMKIGTGTNAIIYNKTNDGHAIIAYVKDIRKSAYAYIPLLISRNKDAVAYSTNHTQKDCPKIIGNCTYNTARKSCDCVSSGYVPVKEGTNSIKYYYSNVNLWTESDQKPKFYSKYSMKEYEFQTKMVAGLLVNEGEFKTYVIKRAIAEHQ